MGKNKFALKCISGEIKHFKTMLSFFLMENRVIMENSIIYLFFETVPYSYKVRKKAGI